MIRSTFVAQTRMQSTYPSHLIKAFGGFENILRLPVLDLETIECKYGEMYTGYLDFVSPTNIAAQPGPLRSIYRGIDRDGRPFIAFLLKYVPEKRPEHWTYAVEVLHRRDDDSAPMADNLWTIAHDRSGFKRVLCRDCFFDETDSKNIGKLLTYGRFFHVDQYGTNLPPRVFEIQLATESPFKLDELAWPIPNVSCGRPISNAF